MEVSERNKIVFPKEEAKEVCTKVFIMCHQLEPYDWSHELYARHGIMVQKFLELHVRPAMEDAKTLSTPHEFLKAWIDIWDDFVFWTRWWNLFFRILDQTYSRRNQLFTTTETCLTKIERMIVQPNEYMITQGMTYLINNDREGEEMDMKLIVKAATIYKSLDVDIETHYGGLLESAVLEATRQYYCEKREEWVASLDSHDYYKRAHSVIKEERTRFVNYLQHCVYQEDSHVIAESNATNEAETNQHGNTSSNSIHQIVCDELLVKGPIPSDEWDKSIKSITTEDEPSSSFFQVVGSLTRAPSRARSRTRANNPPLTSKNNKKGRMRSFSPLARMRSLSPFKHMNKSQQFTSSSAEGRSRSKSPFYFRKQLQRSSSFTTASPPGTKTKSNHHEEKEEEKEDSNEQESSNQTENRRGGNSSSRRSRSLMRRKSKSKTKQKKNPEKSSSNKPKTNKSISS